MMIITGNDSSRTMPPSRLVLAMGVMLAAAIAGRSHEIRLPGAAAHLPGLQHIQNPPGHSRHLSQQPGTQSSGCPVAKLAHGNAARHTCAILVDGSLRCWGYNRYGQLGLNSTDNVGDTPESLGSGLPPVALGANRTARQVAVGGGHTCAVLDNGDVKCWGNNTWGQLGLPGTGSNRGDAPGTMGDYLPPVALGTGRTAQQVVAGEGHACALLDNGSVKCWGYGGYGQLGGNSTSNAGDLPNTMGDALPAVNLGTGRTAQQLAAGAYHTCALLDDSSVKCWGFNQHGELGLGKVSSNGILSVGNTPNTMGDQLPKVDLGTGRSAQSITAGWGHTCVLLDNKSVKCWGWNQYGQLGTGNGVNHGDAPSTMGDNLPTVSLGTGAQVQQVQAGQLHTCAVLVDGQLKCWGRNIYGQLGLNDSGTRGLQAMFMGDALPAVWLGADMPATDITAGYAHSCALLNDSGVRCWGLNADGQLGQGDVFSRGNSPHSLDNLTAIELCAQQDASQPVQGSTATQYSPGSDSAPRDTSGAGSTRQLTTGGIAGIVVGSVVLSGLIIAFIVMGYRWQQAKMVPPPSSPVPRPPPTIPYKVVPRTEGDAFRQLTSQLYSWVWGAELTEPLELIEAGINDLQCDSLMQGSTQLQDTQQAAGRACPAVHLTTLELHEQVHLLADGLIGRGGASLVFKCIWPSRFGANRLLAAKVLRDGYDADPTMLQSFVEEATVLAATQHRNVIKMYGYCLEPPTVCLILELLPTSLKELLYRNPRAGPISPEATTYQQHAAMNSVAGFAMQYPSSMGTTTLRMVEEEPAAPHIMESAAVDSGLPSPASTVSTKLDSPSNSNSQNAHDASAHATTVRYGPVGVTSHSRSTCLDSPATPMSRSSLVSSLRPSPQLSLMEVVTISKDIAAALAYLHNVGLPGVVHEQQGSQQFALQPASSWSTSSPSAHERIVHRDIKPANILINSAGVAKVTDFGLARVHENTTIMTSHVGAGTLPYMAPELLLLARTGGLGQGATNRVDIYSMGILMWEMLTGQLPWLGMRGEAIHAAVLAGQRPQLFDDDAETAEGQEGLADTQHTDQVHGQQGVMPYQGVSRQLRAIIKACWQQRDLRRPSAADLHEMLTELQQQLGQRSI